MGYEKKLKFKRNIKRDVEGKNKILDYNHITGNFRGATQKLQFS